MLKRDKIYKKVISIIAVCCVLFTTFLQSSIIMADDVVLETDTSQVVETETKNTSDNVEVEVNAINEEVTAEEVSASENKEVKKPVQNVKPTLRSIANKSVGQTFAVETDGVQVNYTVLTEDVNLKTGTVKVGTNQTTNGNGITNQETPTNNTLTIPETVTNGEFTYTVTELQHASLRYIRIDNLNLPNSLRKIGPYALAGMGNEKMVIPEGVTHIDDQCFGGDKLRVLKLPSTLETLGSSILGTSGPTQQVSVYYPYKKTIKYSSASGSSNKPFYGVKGQGSANETLIITENAEQYNKMKTDSSLLLTSSGVNCIAYEMPLEFYDKDGSPLDVDKEVTKLYMQDIFWEKAANDIWDYKFTSLDDLKNGTVTISGFPTLPDEETVGYKANYWGMTEMGIVTVSADGKVEVSKLMGAESGSSLAIAFITSPKMFAVEDKFIITETITSNKEYDGESSLKISFNRNVGNYLREVDTSPGLSFYIALVEKNSNSNQRTPSFYSNTLNVKLKNVVDSGEYTLRYNLWDTRVYPLGISWTTQPKDISIQITEGSININPQVDKEIIWTNQTKLPEISAKVGDTPGTYTWEANQTPQLGTHTYNYTFVPNNIEGTRYIDRTSAPKKGNNFAEQSKKGSVEITYKELIEHSVTFVDKDNNVIEVKKVEEGKDVVAPQVPEVIGYTFNGWDKALTNITSDTTIKALYKANKYTLKFDGNGGSNGKDIIGDYNTPIGDLNSSIREGYRFMGWFTQKVGGIEVTKDTKVPLNGATYYAQWEANNAGDLVVDIEKDTPIDVPATKEEIKDAVLTEEEKQEYLSGTDVNIKVIVKRIPEVVDKIVKDALNGRKDGAYFDIAIYKKIGNQPEVKVNAIKKTMRFVIDIPEELYAKKGVNRVFEVMRIHDGKVDFLKDLDTDDKTVTIETDRFSTYVLCYTDSDLSETKPNGPETSDSTNVTELMSLLGVSLVTIIVASKKQKNNSKSRI